MKLGIYSIYDEKAEIHNTPFFQHNDAIAERSYNDLVKDPNTTIGKNPSDYKLYKIGEYDDVTAVIVPLSPLTLITHIQT